MAATTTIVQPGTALKHTSNTQIGPQAVAPPASLVADDEGDFYFHDLPPFPDDVPTAPLLRISLRKLIDRDTDEIDRFWKASCELGFFYLDLRDAIVFDVGIGNGNDDGRKEGNINGNSLLKDAEVLFVLGSEVLSLPRSEKEKYDFSSQDSYFGYTGLKTGVIDGDDTEGKIVRDSNEFYNVSKDDILDVSAPLPAPAILQDPTNRSLLARYISHSHAIAAYLLTLLEAGLSLPPGTLLSLHRLNHPSGDHLRWVRSPASSGAADNPAQQPSLDPQAAALGAHTDFGSLTILFNRLGGLQVLPPGEGSRWSYVRPLRGHAICNLGDALTKFSAGILRSNVHRVVAPPGEQAGLERMSLVFVARPEDEALLAPLEEESEVVRARAREGVRFKGQRQEERVTAMEWIARKARGVRGEQDALVDDPKNRVREQALEGNPEQ